MRVRRCCAGWGTAPNLLNRAHNLADRVGALDILTVTKSHSLASMRARSTARRLLDVRLQGGITPLYTASIEGRVEAVDRLIAARADVNARTDVGPSAP